MTGVQVVHDCRVYWNHSVHDLTAGQEIPSGEFATYLLTAAPDVVEALDAEPEPASAPNDSLAVPDGPAKDVLAWVGSDSARAQQALDAELLRDPPRTTLVTALAKLAPQPGLETPSGPAPES